jgi:hypothetical protein
MRYCFGPIASTRVKDTEMNRKSLQRLLLVLLTVLALGSVAEAAAAPKKTVHHRPKHSTRVASGVKTPRKQTANPPTGAKKGTPPARKPSTKPH